MRARVAVIGGRRGVKALALVLLALAGGGMGALAATGATGLKPIIGTIDGSPFGKRSNGNGVFEAGERVVVAPVWENASGATLTISGTAFGMTGPDIRGNGYKIKDDSANYGRVDFRASCALTGDCYVLEVVAAPRPAVHWDATFTETLSTGDRHRWTLHVGGSFTDVPRSNPFYRFVETLLHKGVTGGCSWSPSLYCPKNATTREQMAVFVLVAKEGFAYDPPDCDDRDPMFADVPASSPFCRWIQELARRGVVSGCAGSDRLYCPREHVSRQQMSVFLLRTLDPAFTPPACVKGSEAFADVPADSPFCPWIEELARRGIVNGCALNPLRYCPQAATAREQMAVFVLRSRDGRRASPPACGEPQFADLAADDPFCPWIEELSRRGVVSGCGGGAYCPGSPVTREQMAVFVLTAKDGPSKPPPACAPGREMFADVPASDEFCPWIEELARRGVVSGCGGGNYCPGSPVTREQMAKFVLASREGAAYKPPDCDPATPRTYKDVPADSEFCPWVEELARRGVVAGCSANPPLYCPQAATSRAQVAVFISGVYELELYGA